MRPYRTSKSQRNVLLQIGAHTVFARQEKCLYFRYVSVMTTHATCFKLYNRNVVPASVKVSFIPESLIPPTAKPDTFVVEPQGERIPPMTNKTFTISFTPTVIEVRMFRICRMLRIHEYKRDRKVLYHFAIQRFVFEIQAIECKRE